MIRSQSIQSQSSSSRSSSSKPSLSLSNSNNSTNSTLHCLSWCTLQYIKLSMSAKVISWIEHLSNSSMVYLRFLPVVDLVSSSIALNKHFSIG